MINNRQRRKILHRRYSIPGIHRVSDDKESWVVSQTNEVFINNLLIGRISTFMLLLLSKSGMYKL